MLTLIFYENGENVKSALRASSASLDSFGKLLSAQSAFSVGSPSILIIVSWKILDGSIKFASCVYLFLFRKTFRLPGVAA